MTVGAEKLVRMAQQIAANVVMSSDPAVVGQGLADHLQRFWDPRMRRQFVEHMQSLADPDEPLKIAAQQLADST